MTAVVAAGAGFLLAVLWFDLMFDVQALGHRDARALPDDVLASTAAYYRRVTTEARPLNRLIGAVMVATLAAIGVQLAGDEASAGAAWASLVLAGVPIGLAGAHTFPAAVRLGRRVDPPELQSRLARSILRDHLFCLASISALLAVQLAFAT